MKMILNIDIKLYEGSVSQGINFSFKICNNYIYKNNSWECLLDSSHYLQIDDFESRLLIIDNYFIDFINVGTVENDRNFALIFSHAEGRNTKTLNPFSHAEGDNTTASGSISHAEGSDTTASGMISHAEGYNTTASGENSHAEGRNTTALNDYSHAEGYDTTASGRFSHAEGDNTTASGNSSHAEGYNTTASGNYSHAGGYSTVADKEYQTVVGKYNTKNNTNSLFVVGNGTDDSSRHDAFVIKKDGTMFLNGSNIFNLIYPVGSIYISKNSTNPATLFGVGTWSLIKGKFIYGADPDNLTNYPINDTGGGSKQISTSNIPKLTSSSDGYGKFEFVNRISGGSNGDSTYTEGTLSSSWAYNYGYAYNSGSGGLNNGERRTVVIINNHTHTVGNTSPTDYMPPYIVRYIWERTA